MLPIIPTSERADLQHLTAQARRANTPQALPGGSSQHTGTQAEDCPVAKSQSIWGPQASTLGIAPVKVYPLSSFSRVPRLLVPVHYTLMPPQCAFCCSSDSCRLPGGFWPSRPQGTAAAHRPTTFSGVRPMPCLHYSFILHSFIFLAKQPFSFSGDENRGYKRWLSAQTQIPSGHDLSSSSTHSAFRAQVGRLPQAGGCSTYRPRYRPGLPARESPGTPETWKQPLGTQERSEGPAGRLKHLPQAGHTAWALMSTHLFPTVSPWGTWKK